MKISVCLATYNGEKFIERQLRSILSQLGSEDEIIVSDDHSTDRTAIIIINCKDPRVKFLYNKGDRGPLGNFENALKNSTGEILFLCDQDDVWLPDKVGKTVQLLQNYDLVLSNCKVVDSDLNEIYPSFFTVRGSKIGFIRNLYKNSYMGCCMAFRRNILSYALPFPRYVHMHDWWIGLLAEIYGKVCFYDEPLILYVRHGDNASPTGEDSYSFVQKLYNRFRLIQALLFRLFS